MASVWQEGPRVVEAPRGECVVWLRSEQMGLALGAAARAGLRVVGVGTPEVGRAGPLAEQITAQSGQACEAHDDLRAALSRTGAGVVWLLTPGVLGESDAGEGAEAVRGCVGRGVRVASLEPLPGSLLGLSAAGGSGGVVRESVGGVGGGHAQGWCALCPAVRWSGPMRDAAALLEQFGPVRAASVRCVGSPRHGSLGARLFEAMDLVHMFVGEPEVIDAAYVGPGGGSSGAAPHAAPGQTLSRLGGEMTANGRLPGKGVSVLVSDRAGEHAAELDLIGAGGRLRVSGSGLVWTDPSGREVDRSGGLFGAEVPGAERGAAGRTGPGRGGARSGKGKRAAPGVRGLGVQGPGVQGLGVRGGSALEELAGAQLARLLSDGPGALEGINFSRVLAMAQAAVLSARTGEGESPATMRRMAGLA